MTDLHPSHIVNINEHNAQQMLIEESQQRLVVAFFWAEANPPSQQMLPLMENIANEYNGDFLLARVAARDRWVPALVSAAGRGAARDQGRRPVHDASAPLSSRFVPKRRRGAWRWPATVPE